MIQKHVNSYRRWRLEKAREAFPPPETFTQSDLWRETGIADVAAYLKWGIDEKMIEQAGFSGRGVLYRFVSVVPVAAESFSGR